MHRTDDALSRIERHLQAAADRFATGLCRHLAEPVEPAPPSLTSAERAERLQTLAAEEARLRRKARRRAPCYDLNRHIAIRRLMACLAPRATAG